MPLLSQFQYIIFLFSLFHPQNIFGINRQIDRTSRHISLDNLLEERFSQQELKNDSGFDYIPSPRIILCSEPSSGNSWCRYALEYLTKRPSTRYFFNYQYDKQSYFSLPTYRKSWFNAINPPWGIQFTDIKTDFSKAPIIKHHQISKIYKAPGTQPLIIKSRDKLILIVRNYKELYFRNFPTGHVLIGKALKNYFELLSFFDRYPSKQKILVYYEDMLAFPEKTFSLLLNFTNDSKKHLSEFIKNIDFHRLRCASLYNLPQHAKSLNKNSLFYTKNLPSNSLYLLEEEVKKEYPNLFEKYLIKY